jgi:predicted RNA-binding protein with PIN domain
MRWLVDGYNVIGADPALAGAKERGMPAARSALLQRIREAEHRCGDPFTVVFDGDVAPGPTASTGRIEVRFSRPPRTADDVIMELVRQLGAGAIVVTSDNKIQNAARRAGAAAVASERFLAALDGLAAAGESEDDEDEDDGRSSKRGNPHRVSKDERAVRRALRRLRG